jgi:CubicO group peptidase (beta-lactamase class C family)
MTKIPTAIAILQLHEQGALDIDDPVTDYVPFFKVEYPSATSKPITIRHLLNHSSGIPEATADLLRWTHLEDEPHPNQTALIERVLPDYAKLTFEPGSQGTYSSVNYMVLGAVIEAASGQTYEDYVAEHILEPLGMEQTGFVYTEKMQHEAVGSHPVVHFLTPMLSTNMENYDGFVRETVDRRIWFNRIYPDQTPPTGLIGPTTDVARLILAYLNDGELDGQRILSAKGVAMMTNESHVTGKGPQTMGYPGMSHGLGWWVIPTEDQTALQHTGGGPGFAALMRLYPDQSLGVVVLGNGTNLPHDGIADLAASLAW